MTTQTEEQQTATKPPQPKNRGKFVILFLILLIASTFMLSYPLWQKLSRWQAKWQQQVHLLNTQVTTLQTELQTLQSQDNQTSLEVLQTQFQELSKQQQTLDNHFTNFVHQMAQQPQNDDDWKLAELHYLLTIALHRLQLASDPDGALLALQTADKRLQNFNKPNLFPIRKQLLEDIQHLRELERPDIIGLAVRLAQYAAQVDSLPLLQGTRQTYTPSPKETMFDDEQSWQELVWNELKQLIVIRYNKEVETGFLTPGQRAFVTQILHLKFENARFFLLRHDTENFAASILTVRDWLTRYYDNNNNKVKALQNDLAQMQDIVLEPTLPDISGSLKLLQRILATNINSSPLLQGMKDKTEKNLPPGTETEGLTQ